ncbi:MAG: inositol monophosphatase [Rhodococcus sp.]|nr:inositol monophosphatase [Rhodococcus sp. (in: high G+C Gram-positive bacteria)]
MIAETIRTQAHPALLVTAEAASTAYREAQLKYSREQLKAIEMEGADGTPTMFIDVLVEDAIIAAARSIGVNVLSEERGWIDVGSSISLVIDPVDGSANAAAGVPLSCFSAAVVEDGEFTEALTSWLHTDERWWASRQFSPYRTSGCTNVADAAVSMLRPHARNWEAWGRVAREATRIRILSCSTIDAAFVANGAIDAFVDAGSDTHRLMDIAAAVVLVEASGGVVLDTLDRPIEFDTDLTRRWSGIVAATEELGHELRELITG